MAENTLQINNNPALKENIEIVKGIKENLVEIKTSIGTENNEDLKFLDEYIKCKEIIGLGEVTHGTKELQDIRTRFISYLVENLGFRTIILEESYGYCLKLNSYILNGYGTAEEAVNEGLCFNWVFKTEEILALVKWMRKYNIKADESNKIRFYGMDLQGPEKFIEEIGLYAKRVDFENYNTIKTYLDACDEVVDGSNYETLKISIGKIKEFFVANKIEYIKNSTQREYDEIYHCIEVYNEWIEYGEYKEFNKRDKSMYETTKWIIENEKKYNEGKVIVIAHNDHISKSIPPNVEDEIPMGYLLKNEYKEKYYTIGSELSRGSFYSWDIKTFELKVYEIDDSIYKDLAARLFEATNIPMFYLDLNTSTKKNISVKNFLSNINKYRAIGAVYDDEDEEWGVTEIALIDMYDAIFYIKDSNNTTLLNRNLIL